MSRYLETPTSALKNFESKLKNDADVLIAIHKIIGGSGQGRRSNFLKTLSRSIVVFSVATMESYFESVSEWAFLYILKKKHLKTKFFNKAADKLAEDLMNKGNKDSKSRIIRIIVQGADQELKDSVLKNEIRDFHTPSVKNINKLVHTCIGIRKISNSWVWQKTTFDQVTRHLDGFLKTRHQIAHGRLTPQTIKNVNLTYATSCVNLVRQIAKYTDKRIVAHLHTS